MVSENDIIYTLCLTGQGVHTVFNIEKSVWDFLSPQFSSKPCQTCDKAAKFDSYFDMLQFNCYFFAIIMFKEIPLDQSPY